MLIMYGIRVAYGWITPINVSQIHAFPRAYLLLCVKRDATRRNRASNEMSPKCNRKS